MRTVTDSRSEVVDKLTGDIERDASEMGLSFNELWEAAQASLLHVAEKQPDGLAVADVPHWLRLQFIEGVLVGIHHARSS